MSSDNRETQHASGGVLPSHPVELGESDMDNSRSVSPEIRQLRNEGREAPSEAHNEQRSGIGHQANTGSQYGEGYTSDGIPPPLNIPGEYSSAGHVPYSSETRQQSSSLQEVVPTSTDRGIADTSNTAEHETAAASSPVSPSKSENRGFFSRVLGSFMPGASSEAESESQNSSTARYLHQAPSASWGKPTDTADIDVVKEQGHERAEETGLDSATATKLAGLDSAAAYNKHEPAIAAAEVLDENKADSRQNTVAAGGLEHRDHSPGRDSEVYATPQASPGHHHEQAAGYEGSQPQSEQYSTGQNTGSSLRSTSFENRPMSGAGWSKYSSPQRDTGSDQSYGNQGYGNQSGTQGYGQGAQSDSYADSSNQQGVIGKLASAVGLGGAQQHEQHDNQRSTGTGYGQGAQSDSYADSSNQQGVIGKLASAVGLGGAQQHEQHDSQRSTGAGYGQGAAAGSYDDEWSHKANTSGQPHQPYLRGLSRNASEDAADAGDSSAQWGRKADTGTEIGYGRTHGNYGELGAQPAESNQQGIVGKLASAVGLGGESAPGTGQGQGGAGGSYTDDWSRKANTSGELHEPYLRGISRTTSEDAAGAGDSSADWARKASTAPHLENTGAQQSYGQGAQTDSYRDTSSNQGAVDKLASAVGLGGQAASDRSYEQYGSQSAQGTGYGQGYGQGQTDSYRDTSNNQGVVDKLASAVGLGGQSAQNQQRDQYDNQAAQGTGYGQSYGQGYGQGAQTDSYTDNSSNQGIGSKLASAVGLGGSSQTSSGQTGTAGPTATGVTRSLSNLPPSASWGTAAKFAPESEETTGQYAQTANTGHGLAPVTEDSTSNRATGSDTGVLDKLTTAVGLGKDSPSGQTSTGSGTTGTGTHNRASEHAPASRVEDRLTEPIHTGTGTSATADRSTYTDAGRRETPVEQSAQAFTDETAPATATETKHTPEAGISSGTGTGLGTSTGTGTLTGTGVGSGTSTGLSSGSGIASGTGLGSGTGTSSGTGLGSGTGIPSSALQSQATQEERAPAAFGTTAAEHALSRTSGTPLSRSSAESVRPSSAKKLSVMPENNSATAQPNSAMGTTAAEHALRRTSANPTNPSASTKQLPVVGETGTGNDRTTSDLPVSTSAPPASARTTQEVPATSSAAKTEGTNGTAAPSTGTSTATKPTTTSAAGGIGSQGKPAVPAQPDKTGQTGKHNGFLACFTCGQKSTVE